MLIKTEPGFGSSEITDERAYLRRREFLRLGAGVALGAIAGLRLETSAIAQTPLGEVTKGPFGTDEKWNSFEHITSYNNFYEFGTDKSDPYRHSVGLKTRPWTVKVDGHCSKPADYQVDDLIRPHQLEERVYRLRCVKGWSMVIPWVGVPLGAVLTRFEPTRRRNSSSSPRCCALPRCPGSIRRVEVASHRRTEDG